MDSILILVTVMLILALGYNRIAKINGLPVKYMPVVLKALGALFIVCLILWLGNLVLTGIHREWSKAYDMVFGHINF